jgi:hypothetical protein
MLIEKGCKKEETNVYDLPDKIITQGRKIHLNRKPKEEAKEDKPSKKKCC